VDKQKLHKEIQIVKEVKYLKKNYKNIYKHNTKETEEQRQWRQNCTLN